MSQHSQRTQQGPSGGQVVAGAVAIALSAAASVYVVSGPGLDPRKAVAVVLGGVLTGLLTVHVMGLVAERAVVADRAERAAERERMIEDYEREIVARERELDTRERELALGRQEPRPGPEPYVVPEPVAPPRWEAPEPPRVDQGWMDAGRPRTAYDLHSRDRRHPMKLASIVAIAVATMVVTLAAARGVP